MAPPGIKVFLRERPEDRCSWSPHALSGWYIDPIIDHYRCHKIWITAINVFHIGQSVSWFTHEIIIRTVTATEIFIATPKDLIVPLRQIKENPLLQPYYTITRKARFQLNSIFSNASSTLKPQQPPTFKLPRVFTPKPIAAPLMLSPSTTQDFTISPLQHKNIADVFKPPNPKLLQKHHIFFSITLIQVQASP